MIAEIRNRILSTGLSVKRPALYHCDSIIAYDELFNTVLIVAEFLRSRGIRPGDRVAFFLPDCPLMVFIILACAEISAVYCGMNIKASPNENTILLQQCRARLVIYDYSLDRAAPKIEGIERISRDELEKQMNRKSSWSMPVVSETAHDIDFGVSFTSGTTGVSKGVLHTLADYFLCGQACINRWGLGADDIVFSSVPLLTTLSLGSAVFPALLSGGGLVISGKRTAAELITTIERYRCTFLVANPTICRRMLMEKAARGAMNLGLRGMTVAGAMVQPELGAAFRRKFRCRVFPHYGMTELLSITSTGTADENDTVGQPFEHVRLRIIDGDCRECAPGETGKIMVKSRTMTLNYLQTECILPIVGDGWFDTGDLGCIDHEGNLHITGRSKDMIIRNGNNVFSQEIECRLLQYAGVIDCAVIGVPEAELGEKIVAFIASCKALTEDGVKKYLTSQLPVYKIPDEIIFVGEIPRNVNQKINMERLRQQYEQGRTMETGNIYTADIIEDRSRHFL
jgi:acyl-CoA synthetase (AMP-forming)/AMP-acid ligase II